MQRQLKLLFSQVLGEQQAQKAVRETISRIQADINDSALKERVICCRCGPVQPKDRGDGK